MTLLGISVLPSYPEGRIEPPDPTYVSDQRVTAIISERDLHNLLSKVREPVWGSFWGLVVRMGEGRHVIEITDLEGGTVEVRIGRRRGPLMGRGEKLS